MAVFDVRPCQGRYNHSALSLPVAGHDNAYEDTDITCSPFSLACNASQRSFSVSPQPRSLLTLRPSPCNSSTTKYRNGQITPTSPQLSAVKVKVEKAPFPPPVVSTWSPEESPRLADLPPSHSDEGPSHWYGSTLQTPEEVLRCTRHASLQKPLLSPIRFDPDVNTTPVDDVEEVGNDQYQSLQDDASSFHSADWDFSVPSRRLSYGEPLHMVQSRSVRNSRGSEEHRPKAGWLAEDKNCDKWIDDTLKAQATRPYHSEPSRRKQRLWLDLVEDDEEIKEAVSISTYQACCNC